MIGLILVGLAALWVIGEVKKANPPKVIKVAVNQLPSAATLADRNVVTGELFVDSNNWDPNSTSLIVVSGIPESNPPAPAVQTS